MDWTTKALIGLGAGFAGYWLLSRARLPGTEVSITQTEARVVSYHEMIWASGVSETIEPAIIAALIQRESSGNPNAVGADGEVGLMQVLPSTGEWICGAGEQSLRDPEINIRCGTKYLGYTMLTFQSVTGMLAAYNAGPSRIGITAAGVTMPTATARYVRDILVSTVRYRSLFRILPEYDGLYDIIFPPGSWILSLDIVPLP